MMKAGKRKMLLLMNKYIDTQLKEWDIAPICIIFKRSFIKVELKHHITNRYYDSNARYSLVSYYFATPLVFK